MAPSAFDHLTPEQLRALAAQLTERVASLDQQVSSLDQQVRYHKTRNEQLAHEIAILKRHKFARRSEQLSPDQISLLDDLLDTDIAAIEAELKALSPAPVAAEPRQQPKRTTLPPQFPRTLVHHEPDNTQCACGCQLKRIGEDVSEKLDYTPGTFTVERHIRGKWVCEQCETLIQAPVPPQVIDKGIPTAGLLAQVMVAKYADHLPLYRQERIFGRAEAEGASAGQLQTHFAMGLAEAQDAQTGAVTLGRVDAPFEDVADHAGGVRPGLLGPADQPLRRPFGMLAMALGHVLGLRAVPTLVR